MRILLVTRLFPLPGNVARGTFVSDHAELLASLGHEVKILNVLPRMLRMNEARRSTMEGVAKAPKSYTHGDFEVTVKRHWEFPDFPIVTAINSSRIKTNWKPDIVICHTIWPAANAAKSIAKKHGVPWVAVVHGHDFDVALNDHRGKRIESLARSADRLVVVSDSLSRFDSITIPWYVALQAGHNPWRFTTLILLVVVAAGVSGWLLIPEYGVMGAAWASVIGCSIMLSFSKLLCGDEDRLSDGLALFCVAICYLLSIGSTLALIGLLTVIPAKHSIDFLRSQTGYLQEE